MIKNAIIAICFFTFCSNNIDKSKSTNIEIRTQEKGTFKDSRDGQEYQWVRMKDGKKWMAQNLNYKVDNSWCYNNLTSNCDKFGRLYNWVTAKKVCPPGWRLPKDKDWQDLLAHYGGCYGCQFKNSAGKDAYEAFLLNGSSGFSALFNGYRAQYGEYLDLNNNSFYWTEIEKNVTSSIAYYISKTFHKIGRAEYDRDDAYSCRCIQ